MLLLCEKYFLAMRASLHVIYCEETINNSEKQASRHIFHTFLL